MDYVNKKYDEKLYIWVFIREYLNTLNKTIIFNI